VVEILGKNNIKNLQLVGLAKKEEILYKIAPLTPFEGGKEL
jgi:hypothetical protein